MQPVTIQGNPYAQAWVQYWGYIGSYAYGHIEMRSGGCPGSFLANSPYDVKLYRLDGESIDWGPLNSSGQWASQWWNNDGAGHYTSWGYVCATF